MKNIILGGLKHCGKTSLGKILAADSGYRFFDLDDLVLEAAGGLWDSVRELWEKMGGYEFRYMEAEAARNFVEWIIPALGGSGSILSLGGGTVENSDALGWVKNLGLKVYLRADAELLYSRIMAHGRPPFLSEDDSHGGFMELYDKRHPLYTEFADIIHDVDDAPKKINAQRLLTALEQHNARQ